MICPTVLSRMMSNMSWRVAGKGDDGLSSRGYSLYIHTGPGFVPTRDE